MKATIRYWFSILLRRLHWFLIPAALIGAIGTIIAMTLPPSYVSQARLVVEGSQIPNSLAPPTVQAAPLEKLQILEQLVRSRANLLDVAQTIRPPETVGRIPDDIVDAMRAQTGIQILTPRGGASQMVVSFRSRSPQAAAGVVGEYLKIIQRQDVEDRAGAAGQTLEFFQQEVTRLSGELDESSRKILEFKGAQADALPEGQQVRLSQQLALQERSAQIDRDIASLNEQRARMVEVFNATGQILGSTDNRTPEQKQLDELRSQLNLAQGVYAPGNPRLRMLEMRISQLETQIGASTGAAPGASPLDLQLAEIDRRVSDLRNRQTEITGQLTKLEEAIRRTAANGVTLEALQRDYDNTRSQYDNATRRLAEATIGERVELQSRGQRITLIEQPVVPGAPSSPNRLKIVAMSLAAGVGAGLALVALLELIKRSPRRPEDLVKKLGIMPIATIPYMRSGREIMVQRSLKVALVLVILIGVPALVWGVHTYYQPLDLLAERVKGKIGL